MKIFLIFIFMMLTFEASSSASIWSFSEDHQHEQQLEQLVQQEQQHSGNLTGIIVVLSVGCIITLVVGTMIGSKTRRASNEKQ